MAITTSQITVTGEWQRVADAKCTLQSEVAAIIYDISVGEDTPSNACIHTDMQTPTTFDWGAPIWVRLHSKGSAGNQQVVNVIK